MTQVYLAIAPRCCPITDMKTDIFGQSRSGLPLTSFEFGTSSKHILIIGGVHGDEIEGVACAWGLYQSFIQSPPLGYSVTLVPQLNIDGVLNKTRQNVLGVDLNRNLPTKDWSPEFTKVKYFPGSKASSEPENQGLMKLLKSHDYKMILSLHSWKPLVNVNGDCNPLALNLSQKLGYIITDDIGYPTPGSLGTLTGLDQNIPTITLEIERHLDIETVVQTHVPAVRESLDLSYNT